VQVIETRGDRIVDRPLPDVGGKGLFTAELESALRAGTIDAAVHSLKDLPVEDPEDLIIGAIPTRAAVHDVLVYDPKREDPEGGTLPITDGSVVGTSSPRRRAAVLAHRPRLRVRDIRGNVPTRIDKVRSGEYGGTLLAAAGLQRLNADTEGLGVVSLPVGLFTPAPGQGALAVQCRREDLRVRQLLAQVHDEVTAASVGAERSLLESLGGGCSMPLGAFVEQTGDGHRMRATLYSSGDGSSGGRAHRFALELAGTDPRDLSAQAAEALRPLVGEPLAGLRVRLIRPGGEGGRLGAGLGVAGGDIQTVALTETVPLQIDADEMGLISSAAIVAFTSARAVDRYFELAAAEIGLRDKRFYAGGPATAAAVRVREVVCRESEAPGGASLAQFLAEAEPGSDPILFPCALGRRPDMEDSLGSRVIPLPVYDTRALPGVELPDTPAHYTVFTSPTSVRAFCAAGHPLKGRTVAIGSTTAAAMRELAMEPNGVADDPTPQALVGQITELHHAHST
jgi:hydroxymethylbilane synthase